MSIQMEEKTNYWFPAMKYGWGWGLPLVWQGWVTLILYLGSIALSLHLFPPEEKLLLFVLATTSLSVLFVVVCWLKGEPPKWRWGKK